MNQKGSLRALMSAYARTWVQVCLVALAFPQTGTCDSTARPFWTEKSSYEENGRLYFVGIASGKATIEEGRLEAYKNAQRLASQYFGGGAVVSLETQMNLDEKMGTTYRVWQLTYLERSKAPKALPVKPLNVAQNCYGQYENGSPKVWCLPEFNGPARSAMEEVMKTTPYRILMHICSFIPARNEGQDDFLHCGI